MSHNVLPMKLLLNGNKFLCATFVFVVVKEVSAILFYNLMSINTLRNTPPRLMAVLPSRGEFLTFNEINKHTKSSFYSGKIRMSSPSSWPVKT